MFDFYVLAKSRSREEIDRFRSQWAAGFTEAEVDYVYPQYANEPEMIYQDVEELIDRLIVERDQYRGIYWTNPEESARQATAMIFFTNDGGLIVGISVREFPELFNEADERALHDRLTKELAGLAESMNADYGLAVLETPPPWAAVEFKDQAVDMRAGFVRPE